MINSSSIYDNYMIYRCILFLISSRIMTDVDVLKLFADWS